MSRYIIRKIPLAHCKKGPQLCAKCREMNIDKLCLLDIAPPHAGEIQRRVIQISQEGESAWCEYDVVKVFESPDEAKEYARRQGIDDIELE